MIYQLSLPNEALPVLLPRRRCPSARRMFRRESPLETGTQIGKCAKLGKQLRQQFRILLLPIGKEGGNPPPHF